MSAKEEVQIPIGEVVRLLDESPAMADAVRRYGLERLHVVRRAKMAGLEREHQRLKKKLEETHPRVEAAAAALKANEALINELAVAIDRAKVEVPAPDPHAWILYGRVLNRERRGVPNLTIGLYDQHGQVIGRWGHARTDQAGAFKVTVRREQIHPADAKHEKEIADEATRAAEEKAAPRPSGLSVLLRVNDQSGTLVYADPIPITPELGKVDYREMILEDGDESPESPSGPPGPKPGPGRQPATARKFLDTLLKRPPK